MHFVFVMFLLDTKEWLWSAPWRRSNWDWRERNKFIWRSEAENQYSKSCIQVITSYQPN